MVVPEVLRHNRRNVSTEDRAYESGHHWSDTKEPVICEFRSVPPFEYEEAPRIPPRFRVDDRVVCALIDDVVENGEGTFVDLLEAFVREA